MELLKTVPRWLLRPLPVNAEADAKLHAQLDKLAAGLPRTISQISYALRRIKMYREYDAAANRAAALVWQSLGRFYTIGTPADRLGLLGFASEHLVPGARARILRRLVKDGDTSVRRKARDIVAKSDIHEVALPAEADGPWDPSGWLRGITDVELSRHKTGQRIQEANGIPVLRTIGDLRKLLAIRSPKQLGWMLLASEKENGPYTTFKIAKRGGGERIICAPKAQLRWVQRRILDSILGQVPAHDAAHGFVPGRSTVTNAEKHRGAALLVKFDLSDFFPTIHYYRVLGLFARLGYTVGNAHFSANDKSKQLAPTLARLCCYTPDPQAWGSAVMPQGAPTSPALSNLVCRRLDARLTGLAEKNKGVYTRYADDLTFSFKKDEVDLGRFRWWIDQICHQEGFFVNQKKFHVIRASQRQMVTGIVVNDELHVPREARRRFRAILHNCKTQGVESQAKGHKRFADYLRGFASYVHMVQPEEGADLLRQVQELLGPDAPPEEPS